MNQIETKCFAEEYESILIKDLMDFQVVFSADLYKDEKEIYHFIIKTNRGSVSKLSSLNINDCYFSHSYYEIRKYEI